MSYCHSIQNTRKVRLIIKFPVETIKNAWLCRRKFVSYLMAYIENIM